MEIISNKNLNYPLSVIVWMVSFFLLHGLCLYGDLDGKFWLIGSIVVGALIAFGDRKNVPIMTEKLLIFNGSEVKDEFGNSTWVGPGNYFMFWIFSFAEGESDDMEIRNVIVPSFTCQDKTGKSITIDADGDWQISNFDNFKVQKEDKMVSNLISLVKKYVIKACGKIAYKDYIKGDMTDLGQMVLSDDFFRGECRRYGVEFHNLLVSSVLADLKQENSNAFAKELFEEEKKHYPTGHKFTHQELEDIRNAVQVQLSKAKKVITSSPTVTRIDADDNH